MMWAAQKHPVRFLHLLFGPALLLAGLTGTFSADSSAVQFQDIFVAGTGGYHTYRIPAIVTTTNGTLLAFCEGRKNSRGDTGNIDLLWKRSTDGGKSWSAQRVLWEDADNVCGNPAPVVDRITGEIWLLLTWNAGSDSEKQIMDAAGKDKRRVFVSRSNDDGRTWATPHEITRDVKKPQWGWYATGPVNGIQTVRGPKPGRLVVPCNHSDLSASGSHPIRSHVIYSDDHGHTWKIGGIEEEMTNESTLAELSDGRLLHNMRSYHKKNRRAIAWSEDAGITWTPVRLDEALIEPVCQASLLRYSWPGPGSKSRLLFSNPASQKREKMTVRVSYDEGQTWPVLRELHAGPSAYSCLAALPDGTVVCLFERGTTNAYERIVLATFGISALESYGK